MSALSKGHVVASSATVTVALPYAKESLVFVERALASLQAQNHNNWRGIVVDDSPGGESRLVGLVESYNDPRLAYMRYEGPHGIGYAWNACADVSDTELLSILHTDDELEPTYLSRMLELAHGYPDAAMYFCRATIIDKAGKPCFSLADKAKDLITPRGEPIVLSGAFGVRALAVGDFIICPTILYRTALFKNLRFSTRHNFVLDLRFMLSALYEGATITGTRDRVYRYRRHAGQWTSAVSASGHRFSEEIEVLREVERIFLRTGLAVGSPGGTATVQPTPEHRYEVPRDLAGPAAAKGSRKGSFPMELAPRVRRRAVRGCSVRKP